MQSKETRPLVSCITTTYKKFNYLYQTLDSIFMQDYPNIEIIIGDDGSSDFPEQELKNYIEKHKGKNITNVVIHHEEKNRGTVSNSLWMNRQMKSLPACRQKNSSIG